MDINMTLLLALSVLLASPCHLAAPEFFVRDLGAGVFLDTFLFLLHWGQLSRGGILSLCFKDRSQSSFHAGWGGGEYWKLGSCPLFPFELFPSFSYWKLIVGLAFLPTWIISIFSSECWGCLAWISPVRQGGESVLYLAFPQWGRGGRGGEYWKQLLPILQGWGTLSLPTSKSE